MQSVGHHLQIAVASKTGDERDLFARSAYNRYYYGTFLLVRGMLASMNQGWSRTPHKSYAEILTGNISRRLKDEKRRANKVRDYDLLQILDAALGSARELAELMKNAYATRVTADYEPSIFVDFDATSRFSLNGIDITEAHAWEGKARLFTQVIQQAWNQLDD